MSPMMHHAPQYCNAASSVHPPWVYVCVRLQGPSLEALPVDDGRARLIVLLLGDPHLLEGGERGQDGATDPH